MSHLVSIFGPKARSQPSARTSPFHRVPPNWVAKAVANRSAPVPTEPIGAFSGAGRDAISCDSAREAVEATHPTVDARFDLRDTRLAVTIGVLTASVRAIAPSRARGRKHHLMPADGARDGLHLALALFARVVALAVTADPTRFLPTERPAVKRRPLGRMERPPTMETAPQWPAPGHALR
jgi:hypothetical protein